MEMILALCILHFMLHLHDPIKETVQRALKIIHTELQLSQKQQQVSVQ